MLVEIIRGPVLGKFSKGVRSFSKNLNNYSSRAYKFVRRTFIGKLPHPRDLDEISSDDKKKIKRKRIKQISDVNPIGENNDE